MIALDDTGYMNVHWVSKAEYSLNTHFRFRSGAWRHS